MQPLAIIHTNHCCCFLRFDSQEAWVPYTRSVRSGRCHLEMGWIVTFCSQSRSFQFHQQEICTFCLANLLPKLLVVRPGIITSQSSGKTVIDKQLYTLLSDRGFLTSDFVSNWIRIHTGCATHPAWQIRWKIHWTHLNQVLGSTSYMEMNSG